MLLDFIAVEVQALCSSSPMEIMSAPILAAIILLWAANRFVKPRSLILHQILFWLTVLALSTAIADKYQWPGTMVILLFIEIGMGIFMLSLLIYVRRSMPRLRRRFAAMPTDQRDQAFAKVPKAFRQTMIRELTKEAKEAV